MTSAPVLEMLWEPYDPGRALDEGFGFSDGPAAARWITDTVAGLWCLRVESCERIVMSSANAMAWVTTPSGRMLVKWSVASGRFPRLAEVARLIGWLNARGVPVSAPVPTRDGRLQAEVDGVSVGLQRVIEGDLLDTTDPAQVRAAGATLARLQEALAAYPYADGLTTLDEPFPPLVDRVTGWLASRFGHLPAAARDRLRELVAVAPPDRLPGQLVHFDFRSANILAAGGEITAVLDFEEARHEHPLAELARAAVMLGTRYHDWGPVPPEVHAWFLAGYQSVHPLSLDETAWCDLLLLFWSMAMVPDGDDPTGWGRSALAISARLSPGAVSP